MCVCNKSLSLTRTHKRTKYCDSLLHWCARYILKERIFKKEEEEEDGSKSVEGNRMFCSFLLSTPLI